MDIGRRHRQDKDGVKIHKLRFLRKFYFLVQKLQEFLARNIFIYYICGKIRKKYASGIELTITGQGKKAICLKAIFHGARRAPTIISRYFPG
jgi:hypothetical protein